MPKNAILFNGAASLIAQEAGILDLLLGNVEDVPGVLNIPDVKFVGGLSSGALMTFSFNAAFGENSKITWDQLKAEVLLTLTTDKVYTGTQAIFNTDPLRELLQELTTRVGLHLIKDLPFESAILTTNNYISLETGKLTNKTYWLTNIEKVASVLPSETDTLDIAKNIKDHQLDIRLVSALMCSTAIPLTFPPQKLYYKGLLNIPVTIKNRFNGPAYFVDGGAGDGLVFSDYREFFDVYQEHFDKFDNIYFISPNYTLIVEETLQRIRSLKSSSAAEEEEVPEAPLLIMDNLTKAFIKDIKAYNSDGHLAKKIYYCKPDLLGFNVLDFNKEQEQYDQTIAWGKSNPDKIAIDISTIPDSELEPTPLKS